MLHKSPRIQFGRIAENLLSVMAAKAVVVVKGYNSELDIMDMSNIKWHEMAVAYICHNPNIISNCLFTGICCVWLGICPLLSV